MEKNNKFKNTNNLGKHQKKTDYEFAKENKIAAEKHEPLTLDQNIAFDENIPVEQERLNRNKK